jgi:hypothetical protein
MEKKLIALSIFFSFQSFAFTASDNIRYLDDSENSSTGARGTYGRPGQLNYGNWDGKGSCENVPASVKTAYREALAFTKSCSAAAIAPGKKLAVNDYSGSNSPKMYIFDQDGNCEMAVPVSWGSGAVPRGSLKACSTTNSKQTPPGFHITAAHTGGSRFSEDNSIGLAGLSGQNSLGARGILIHSAGYAGTGSSWGCSAVPTASFPAIKSTLGYGSLVYNYFGNVRSECGTNAGFPPPICEPEPQAVSALQQSRAEAGVGRVRIRNKLGTDGPSSGFGAPQGGKAKRNEGTR